MDYDTAERAQCFKSSKKENAICPDSDGRVKMMFEGGNVAEHLAETEIQRKKRKAAGKTETKKSTGYKMRLWLCDVFFFSFFFSFFFRGRA